VNGTFCHALMFEGEISGLCCSGGKVSLTESFKLSEPLNVQRMAIIWCGVERIL